MTRTLVILIRCPYYSVKAEVSRYSRRSLALTSLVVKRQLMVAAVALRLASDGAKVSYSDGHPVGVQVVQNHPGHRDAGIGLVHQPSHLMGKVLHGAPLCYRHMAPAPAGFAGEKQVAGPIPQAFVVLTPRTARGCRNGWTNIGQQLGVFWGANASDCKRSTCFPAKAHVHHLHGSVADGNYTPWSSRSMRYSGRPASRILR